MPKDHTVPLDELSAAVQSAVEQVLGKHAVAPIGKIFVGFEAPESIASQANANAIAAQLGKEGHVTAQGSVTQVVAPAPAAGGVEAEAAIFRPKFIGLQYQPQ
jgi:hypothetical protein